MTNSLILQEVRVRAIVISLTQSREKFQLIELLIVCYDALSVRIDTLAEKPRDVKPPS